MKETADQFKLLQPRETMVIPLHQLTPLPPTFTRSKTAMFPEVCFNEKNRQFVISDGNHRVNDVIQEVRNNGLPLTSYGMTCRKSIP